MNRRVLAGFAALALLAVTAGCSGFLGPGQANPSDLAASETYEWNESADAYLEVNRNNVTAVYRVANRTTGRLNATDPTVEIYTRDTLGTEQPETVSAVQFRYPNGTHVAFREADGNATAYVTYPNGTSRAAPDLLTVDRTRRRTVVGLPANDTGKLGVTTPKNGKQVAMPAYVAGSYEMVLPENAEVGVPLLGQVRPGATERELVDGRVRIRWESLTASNLVVRYYLGRDLLLFGALAVGGTALALGGAAYFVYQLRETRRRREEVALDVETGDDDRDDGPPPGMR
ncbi:DUF5803 family protein [Halosegnis marinus]|uniref:DUF5803 family protein n=1 Tax=Halosegnis marinus TaxID=3034023 RepID=A0ABD5ZRY1_9EURY|nr:DUF5803 family protein [Halosegnis sp. DT85]